MAKQAAKQQATPEQQPATKVVFYTVAAAGTEFKVKWLDPDEVHASKIFPRTFDDPGEASQEFKLSLRPGYTACWIHPASFAKKARALAELHQAQATQEQKGA